MGAARLRRARPRCPRSRSPRRRSGPPRFSSWSKTSRPAMKPSASSGRQRRNSAATAASWTSSASPSACPDLLAELVDAAGVGADAGQQRHRLLQEAGAAQDGVAHALQFGVGLRHLEQRDGLRRLLHLVDRVVHPRDQRLDVAAVEGGDEGAPDRLHHLPGDDVGFLLSGQHGRVVAAHRLAAVEHAAQLLRPAQDGVGVAGVHVEEPLLARQQATEKVEHRAPLSS